MISDRIAPAARSRPRLGFPHAFPQAKPAQALGLRAGCGKRFSVVEAVPFPALDPPEIRDAFNRYVSANPRLPLVYGGFRTFPQASSTTTRIKIVNLISSSSKRGNRPLPLGMPPFSEAAQRRLVERLQGYLSRWRVKLGIGARRRRTNANFWAFVGCDRAGLIAHLEAAHAGGCAICEQPLGERFVICHRVAVCYCYTAADLRRLFALSNTALAHEDCNAKLRDRPIT